VAQGGRIDICAGSPNSRLAHPRASCGLVHLVHIARRCYNGSQSSINLGQGHKMRLLAALSLSAAVAPALAQSSYGAAFASGTQPGAGDGFSLQDIASRAASATRPTPKTTSIQAAGQSCSNGFLGMVTVTPPPRYRLPDPPAGQARGVIVRYVDLRGNLIAYELQVKLAPHPQDVGKDGAVAIVFSEEGRTSVIKPDGTPSYTRIYRHRANTWTELATPAYREPLRPLYAFTRNLGKSLPGNEVAIHIGYGLVSEQARQETARRSRATQTILPRVLAGLQQEQERARQHPEEAAQALGIACRSRGNPGADSGVTALTGEEGAVFAANQSGLQSLCATADGPMAAVCQLANAQQHRATAVATAKAGAIASSRAQASGGSAGKRKEDPEMDGICARRDFDAWIARRARDAQLQAKDTENMARAGVWDLRSAVDDASSRGLCWKVIEWQGSSHSSER